MYTKMELQERNRKYYLENRERILGRHKQFMEREVRYRREYKKSKRTQLIEILGNKCVRCGFSDIRALQLDHINGGGHKECVKFGHRDAMISYYLKHREETYKLQVLCANCNWIKRHENNENRTRKYL